MVDPNKAGRLLGVLLDALSDLRRYRAGVTREALNTNRDTQHMVLHALDVAVQAAVDLAMHVAADGGHAQPATYQGVFYRLAESGVLEDALAKKLAGWAGFRNVLAHFYAVVDHDRAYDALSEIEDLERFAAVVSGMLDTEG